jgi:FtsP/CotA-like multicopper oxidase with cupredoxin domain
VGQYEIAQDGLTRHHVRTKQVNILNPGQRSDVLVTFREAGLYCILDQPGSGANTIGRLGGRLGSKSRQLLGFVVVLRGTPVSGTTDDVMKQTLRQDAAGLPREVQNRLGNFDTSDFAYFPPSQPPGGDLVNATVTGHPSSEFVILGLPLAQGATLPPGQPAPNESIAGIVGMVKNTAVTVQGSDVLAYSHDVTYQAVLGTVDEWTLGSTASGPGTIAAPHVFHIHVNPFQVIDIKDVTANNQSIFDANGQCKPIYLQPTIQDSNNTQVPNPQYSPEFCDDYHVFRDTIFVKPNFLVTTRTAYDDFIGEYVMHCHILDHEDQGMMQNVTIISSTNQEPAAPLKLNTARSH